MPRPSNLPMQMMTDMGAADTGCMTHVPTLSL